MKLLYKFIQLDTKEKMLFFEAVFFLFFSKALILILPLKTCVKLFKPSEITEEVPADKKHLRNIRDAVIRANRLAFWENICLVKSFAARFMLQRRHIGSVMILGLYIDQGNDLKAHAWLKVNNFYITPRESQRFREIYRI